MCVYIGVEMDVFLFTGTATDAHGVDANGVGATAHSHTDSENLTQRLSHSVTVPNSYFVTFLFIASMSGTALSESAEFGEIYNLCV